MRGDPWANYDAWLERPYQDMCREQEHQEWIEENTTYETECCGVAIDQDEAWELIEKRGKKDAQILCTGCDMLSAINAFEPAEYDGDCDEPPDFDDRDYPEADWM